MTRIILAVSVALLAVAPAGAQQDPADSSHAAAALELIELVRMEEFTTTVMNRGFTGMGVDNPAAERVALITREFMAEFMPWEAIRTEHARAYQEIFTETELREVIAFYQTPIGQKMIDAAPRLFELTTAATQRLIMPHMPELQRRILSAMQ